MNSKQRRRFYFSYLCVHLVGSYLASGSTRATAFFAGFTCVSLLLLLGLRYGRDFYLTSRQGGQRNQELFLAGQKVSSEDVEASREDRFLNLFTPGRAGGRKILSFLVLFGGAAISTQWLQLSISPALFLMLLSCWFIIIAGSLGQLLIPLGMNALGVLAAFPHEGGIVIYPIYCAAFLSCLAFMRALSEGAERPDQVHTSDGFRRDGALVRWVVHGTLFCGLCFSFSALLPSQQPEFVKPSETSKREKLMTRAKSEQAKLHKSVESLDRLAPLLPPGATVQLRGKLEHKISELGKAQDLDIQELQKLFTRQVQDREELAEDFARITEGLGERESRGLSLPVNENFERFSEEEIRSLENLQRENGLVTAGQLEGLEKFLEAQRQDTSLEGLDRFREGQEIATELRSAMTSNRELGHLLSKTRETDQYDSRIRSLAREVQFHGANVQDRFKEYIVNQNPTPAQLGGADDQDLEILEKSEKTLTFLERLRRALPLLVGGMIFLWLRRLFRKKNIKELEVDTSEVTRELRSRWRKIKDQRLSPREEVIQFYNFFHESIRAIHYEGKETPPSCVLRDDLTDANPDLGKANFAVTEVFAQCFYGSKNVEAKNLQHFRRALKKLLRFYRLG